MGDIFIGGERGIRTLGRVTPTLVFKTSAFNLTQPSLQIYSCVRSTIAFFSDHTNCVPGGVSCGSLDREVLGF